MAIRMSASLGMLLDGRYAPNMPRFPLCDQHHRPGDTIQIQFGGQSLRHAQCTQYPCLRDPQFPKSTQSLAHSPEFEEEGRPAVATVGCLFGPVLLTGLYCVVTHVVSPRSTHACRTQSPLVARLAGNTLLLRKEISFRSVRLANTKPTAVAAGHSRQRAGIRARRPSESSLDLRCQLLPGCHNPASRSSMPRGW